MRFIYLAGMLAACTIAQAAPAAELSSAAQGARRAGSQAAADGLARLLLETVQLGSSRTWEGTQALSGVRWGRRMSVERPGIWGDSDSMTGTVTFAGGAYEIGVIGNLRRLDRVSVSIERVRNAVGWPALRDALGRQGVNVQLLGCHGGLYARLTTGNHSAVLQMSRSASLPQITIYSINYSDPLGGLQQAWLTNECPSWAG